MTFIYEPDQYCVEIYHMCKYELPTSRLLKLIVRQTEATEIIHYAASRVVNYNSKSPRYHNVETYAYAAKKCNWSRLER